MDLFFIALLLLSGGLIWRGFHGYRTGSTPVVCRKCGYDLSGRPANAAHCSECGADLPSAIQIGRLQRRPRSFIAGALLAIPGIIWVTSPQVRRLAYSDWQPLKPAFWLIWEMRWGGRITMQRAVDEMAKRLEAKELDRDQREGFISSLLQLQLKAPPAHLGKIFIAARQQGQLSDAQWNQFWQQAFPCNLNAQLSASANPALQVWLSSSPPQWRYSGPPDVAFGLSATTLRVGETECETTYLNLKSDGANTRKGRIQTVVLSPASQPNGATRQQVSATLTLFIADSDSHKPGFIAKIPIQFTTDVILPAGQTVVGLSPPAPRP